MRFEPNQLLTASPYGQTQELDLQNLRQDAEDITINQILQSQSDDIKTEEDLKQAATYRVANPINIYYKDEFPSYLLQSSDDKNSSEIQLLNFGESQNQSFCDVSSSNQFKRMKNHQPTQSRDSLSSTRKSVLAALNNQGDTQQISLKIQQQSDLNVSEQVQISFTNQNKHEDQQISFDQKSLSKFKSKNTHRIGKLKELTEDKENQNSQANQQQSNYLALNVINNEEATPLSLRIINQESQNQKQLNISKASDQNEKSFKRKTQFKSAERFQDTSQNVSTNSNRFKSKPGISNNTLELSLSNAQQQSPSQTQPSKKQIEQPDIISNTENLNQECKEQLQQSPGPDLEMTMQQSFKRNRPSKSSNAASFGRSENNPLRRQPQIQQQSFTSNNSHILHKSINLNQCQRQENSNTKYGFASQMVDISQIEQQSSVDIDLSMQMNPIQEEINQIQQKQKIELLSLKKENIKLTRELENKKKLHQEEIHKLNKANQELIASRMKEVEEENQIIIDGLKQEFSDKIFQLNDNQFREIQQLKQNHALEIQDKDEKIARKREKIYKLRDQFDSKRKEYNALIIELEAYKNKVEEMTQYQLQNNVQSNIRASAERSLQTSQSCDNFKTSRQINNNQVSYFSSREDDHGSLLSDQKIFVKDSNFKQPTPYQSCDEFQEPQFKALQDQQSELREAIKQVNSNLNYESVSSSLYSSGRLGQTNITGSNTNALANLPNDEMMNYYFSLSQQQPQKLAIQNNQTLYPNPYLGQLQSISDQDSAMNFSFSEVKTSIDNKNSFFEKVNGLSSHQPFAAGFGKKNKEDQTQYTQLDKITQENESEENQYSEEKDKIVLMKRKPRSYVTSAVQEDSCFNYSPKMGSINLINDESLSLHTARDCETLRDNQISNNQPYHFSQDQSVAQHSKSQSIYSNALMHMESHKSQALSLSSNLKIVVREHFEDGPALENCVDDEEGYEETEVQEPHETSEDEEDHKSNLSHKLENMNASMNMSIVSEIQQKNSAKEISNSNELEINGHRMKNNIIYQIDEDLQSREPSKSSIEGSENAPEDSGFLSEDGEGQERIVNESSLCNDDENEEQCYGETYSKDYFHKERKGQQYNLHQDIYSCHDQGYENYIQNQMRQEAQNMILTGRSESAMDEQDDEIESISKCKAINSSYINLKRNNLLQIFGNK